MSYLSSNKIRFALKEVILNQNMFQRNNFLELGCSNRIDTDKMRTAHLRRTEVLQVQGTRWKG